MTTVGVRELKNRLSYHLKRVRQGQQVLITERGRPVAMLAPVDQPAVPEGILRMIREGRASWSGGKPRGARRPIHAPKANLTQAVLDGRRDRV